MDNLSSYIQRFFRRMVIFIILIAIAVIGIPTLIIFIQHPNSMNGSWALKTADPSHLANRSKPTTKNPSEIAPSKLVTLGWMVGNNHQLASYDKLKIVSPLFATINSSYNLHLNCSPTFISSLQKEGKKVWGRVTLGNQSDTSTHQFLKNSKVWKQVIREIKTRAQQNHLDGLNLDIEQIPLNDRKAFSQFVMSLSKSIIPNHITLSIDIQPEPLDRSSTLIPFNRQLSKYSDYIVFMGYDQHWSTDSSPGPVTSLNWLEGNVKHLIETGVSPQKLIIGLPSYTRIWEVDQSGNTITSMALANQYVSKLLKQTNRPETWDPKQATYDVTYNKNGKRYKVWLTNDRSLQIYFDLVEKYRMAGVGIWNLDMMSSKEWNQLINQI